MAPTQAVWDAHPEAQAMLNELPPILRNDPDIRAIIYCQAREGKRTEATVDAQIAESFPQKATALGLPWWESLVRVTIAPSGQTIAQRQNTVVAMLQKLANTPSGLDWIDNVTALVGAGWTHAEHDPSNPASPPANTIRINLPTPPSSSLYAQVERLLREITPAHLDIELFYAGGFLWDRSQLDQEGWA